LHKADKTEAVDAVTGENVELFNPLRSDWDDHFALGPDGRITGTTPTGRATVVAPRHE
jgi:hypothetical protein